MKKQELWRICAYFIIYSFAGFVFETLYALIFHRVLESRQSFLYGPFCGIYGVGATLMIITLRKYKDNNIKLFLGGMLVGSVAEYIISLVGEILLGIRCWDYSNYPLNINGRICILFSICWGVAAFLLIKFINPAIDLTLDEIIKKVKNTKYLKILLILIMTFILIDCIITFTAVDFFIANTAEIYNLELMNEEKVGLTYRYASKYPKLKNKLSAFASNERMIMTYPNLTLTLKDGTQVLIKSLMPEVRDCYYRF